MRLRCLMNLHRLRPQFKKREINGMGIIVNNRSYVYRGMNMAYAVQILRGLTGKGICLDVKVRKACIKWEFTSKRMRNDRHLRGRMI